MDGRLFGLDIQLLFDALIMFIFLMILYVVMSNLFFKPVRAFLARRQLGIDEDKTAAQSEQQAAAELKAIYETKLKEVHREAESLMSVSRRQTLSRQEEVIAQAHAKAAEITRQADREVELEKDRIKIEVKQQMSEIAGLMAAPYVKSADPFREALMVEEALKEMGGETWQS